MLWSFAYLGLCRLLALLVLLCRSVPSKELEILVLRHELAILRRQARRPQLRQADRVLLAALSRALPRRTWSIFSVSPRTLLRWHQLLVARRWTLWGFKIQFALREMAICRRKAEFDGHFRPTDSNPMNPRHTL